MRRARRPKQREMVTTSREVLDGAPITIVVAWDAGWMLISGRESDHSEPLAVHFHDLCELDVSLYSLRLTIGQYAVRAPYGTTWHVYGPMDLDDLDDALTSGRVVDQLQALADGDPA